MTDRIAPALSAEQWDGDPTEDGFSLVNGTLVDGDGMDIRAPHQLVAAANAVLSDSRKITRQWVIDLGVAQERARLAVGTDCANGPCEECTAACEAFCARLQRMADALASYLPPPNDIDDDARLRAHFIAEGLIDEHGRATPALLENSWRILNCVGGPHDGEMIGIKGTQPTWTGPGHKIGAQGPDGGDVYLDPPPGGVYHVLPTGTEMEWIRDPAARHLRLSPE